MAPGLGEVDAAVTTSGALSVRPFDERMTCSADVRSTVCCSDDAPPLTVDTDDADAASSDATAAAFFAACALSLSRTLAAVDAVAGVVVEAAAAPEAAAVAATAARRPALPPSASDAGRGTPPSGRCGTSIVGRCDDDDDDDDDTPCAATPAMPSRGTDGRCGASIVDAPPAATLAPAIADGGAVGSGGRSTDVWLVRATSTVCFFLPTAGLAPTATPPPPPPPTSLLAVPQRPDAVIAVESSPRACRSGSALWLLLGRVGASQSGTGDGGAVPMPLHTLLAVLPTRLAASRRRRTPARMRATWSRCSSVCGDGTPIGHRRMSWQSCVNHIASAALRS
jgi:hypothetical protein